MRIAYLNNFFLPRPSGSSHLTAQLAARFAERGDEVLVVTGEYDGAPADERRDGYRVRRLPSLTLPRLDIAFNFDATVTASPANVRRVFRELDAFRPDVVHAHGQFFDLTFVASWWARRRRVPLVISVHTRLEHPARLPDALLQAADRTVIRTLTRWADPYVVVMDRQMHDYIRARYRIRDARLVPIPVGVDVDRFTNADATGVRRGLAIGDAPLILSVGHVIAIRNRLTLVEAMPAVLAHHPDAKLVVVGAVYDDRFLVRARELDVHHAVVCTGKVDKDDVPAYVAAADIETHDLEGIGLGTASLEVMAAGVPTIAAVRPDNFLGLRLRNWHDLVLVDPGDAHQLSRAILRLLADPELRRELGENQRKLVDRNFAMTVVADDHRELYRRAISDHR
jgi:glycosyltransferase involved in cell wall biosynthesis